MDKIFKSKIFVVVMPIITFLLFLIAGWQVSYLPYTRGDTYGFISSIAGGTVKGSTTTTYVFHINNAIGVWLIGFVISISVLLMCVLIRKVYLGYTLKIEKQPKE